MTFDKDLLIGTINDWRHLRKMTVRDLAEMADIPEPTLQNMLAGKVDRPSFESVCALCQALEHPITELEAILRYQTYEPQKTKGTKFLLNREEQHMRDLDLLRNEQVSFYKARLEDHRQMYDTVVATKDELIAALRHQITVMDKLLQNMEKGKQ